MKMQMVAPEAKRPIGIAHRLRMDRQDGNADLK
jgi:hypothetical protein